MTTCDIDKLPLIGFLVNVGLKIIVNQLIIHFTE